MVEENKRSKEKNISFCCFVQKALEGADVVQEFPGIGTDRIVGLWNVVKIGSEWFSRVMLIDEDRLREG